MTSTDDDSSLDSVLRGVAASPPRSPPPRWVAAVLVRFAQGAASDTFERIRRQSAAIATEATRLPDGTVRLSVDLRGTPSEDAVVAALDLALVVKDGLPGARIAVAAERVEASATVAGAAARVRATSVLEADADEGIFVDEATAGLAARAFEPEARGMLHRVVARREGVLAGASPSPGTTVGRFVLLEPLGAGGTAVVWAAYDPQLARKIALKFLRSEMTRGTDFSRLFREAQALARLSHPNVLTIHDVGSTGDVWYIAEGRWSKRVSAAKKRERGLPNPTHGRQWRLSVPAGRADRFGWGAGEKEVPRVDARNDSAVRHAAARACACVEEPPRMDR